MPWWEPFEEMERMRRKMTRLMKKLKEPIDEELSYFGNFPVDIEETDDKLIIKADLPGFNKEDISIKATDTTVEIAAQHKEKKIERTEKMFRAERKFGAVRRAFTLPAAINPDRIEADFNNGVLTLKAEKKEKKRAVKEVKIK